MADVFISYSHQDSNYTHRIADKLEQKGFSVWIDERIEYGERWFKTITQAIHDCQAVVVIMTPEAEQSEWVERELLVAIREQKTIFPLLLRGQEFPILITTQFTDVRNGNLPSESFYSRLSQATSGEYVDNATQFTLPMLEWLYIPSGMVILEGIAYSVSSFSISKYPVTNEQFQTFVDTSDGYANVQWWDYSSRALRWREEYPSPRDTAFPGNRHPRTNVSWYEAIAFCKWLSHKTDKHISLPTEQQWQRAAQGDDYRKYPWGNSSDKTKCNTSESNLGQTTPVNQFPDGASPFGVMDMSGNVLEWCLNMYETPNSTDITVAAARALRGGSWNSDQGSAATTSRLRSNPKNGQNFRGFRLYASKSPSEQ